MLTIWVYNYNNYRDNKIHRFIRKYWTNLVFLLIIVASEKLFSF